jgi:hypothetical protein
VTTHVIDRAAVLWDGGEQWDAILGRLRAEGFSKIECIRATVELLRLPLGEAKRVVHDSQTWADVRERDDEWHDRLVIELEADALGGQ